MTAYAAKLFSDCIMLYLLAAIVSLVLVKRQRICSLASSLLCIAASVDGAAASVIKILTADAPVEISLFKSAIPYMALDMKIDNLSAFFMLMLSVLVLCVSIYSIGYISRYIGKRNVSLFYFLYSTFILSLIFVFTAANAVFFYIAWEVMSVLSYFLVIFESEREENRKAGLLYIIMTHIAAAFLLIGFMIIFSYTKSFDMFESSAEIPVYAKNIVFIALLIGFATKAGAVPVHIWLPPAYSSAPDNVTAIMSGVMSKTAVYGILRFIFSYLGVQNTWWGIAILVIGIVSAVLGVAYAFVETNIKRLLAYSSIENIGIIFIGMGIGFISFAKGNVLVGTLALTACLLHALNHTLFKGGLFLGAGSVQYSTHTRNMEELGGLIKKMPVTALFILGGSLAASALVPLNGFISEWLTYQSIFASIAHGQAFINIVSIISVAALAMAGALAAASFVKLFGIAFLGLPRSERALHAQEVPYSMSIGTGILVALCLLIGLFPMAALKLVDGAVSGLTGTSVLSQLEGGLFIAWYPLSIAGSAVSPLAALGAIAGVIALSLIAIRLVGGKYIERKYGTWDCGFEALNSRMQYSAAGFSKPVKIVFKMLFRPSRKITITGAVPYHPETIEYATTSESIIEKKVYKPFSEKITLFSRWVKFNIQTGSIRGYLLYIFAVLVLLMAYNRFA